MFLNLFIKEFKYTFKNISFYILAGVIMLFCLSQANLPSSTKSFKPLPPDKVKTEYTGFPYGVKAITDHNKEIRAIYIELDRCYKEGNIYKNRLLINVKIKLSDAEKKYIRDAMDSIAPPEYFDSGDDKLINVSYSKYLSIIRALDKKLGGSTRLSDENRHIFLTEPKTYEDALKEYDSLINRDRITNAAAREAADYMGITAGLFPVFLAAFILIRDKRSRMQELICSRSVSSFSYILSKYAALCAAVSLPYIVLDTLYTFAYWRIAQYNNYSIDIPAFYKYTLWWVIPTILFTISLGMLISAVSGSGIAVIPVQFIFWMYSITSLKGNYSLSRFIIRFNVFGDYENYIKWSSIIMKNRIFYIAVSAVLILITAAVWSKKRGSAGERMG